MQKPIRVLLFAVLLLAIPLLSSAQTTIEAVLSAPDTTAFPDLQAYLNVWRDDGRFISGLTASDLKIIENGQEIAVNSLEEQFPGVQIAIAINPNPAFSVRDTTGISRYELAVQALQAWIDGQKSREGDVLSLFMTANQSQANLSSYRDLADKLDALPLDHRLSESNFKTLSDAITAAGDQTNGTQRGRAVLFITPEANSDSIAAIDNLTQLAVQQKIRVFVWMITSEAYFESSGAKALEQLTSDTGGQFFAYSGTETFPDPEIYFDPLRHIYSLSYTSLIRTAGDQEISVNVTRPGSESASLPVPFSLTVLPPNPIFVSPPDDIYRSLVPDIEGNLSAERRSPLTQTIDILIEFPDGYSRELVRTTLYMDGQIVAENTKAPFDRFEWSIGNINESGRFTLQVEALDTLGLSSISLDKPVNITVQRMPEGFVPVISQNSPLVVTVVVVLVGAVLITVLLRIRRLRPEVQPGNGKTRPRTRKTTDPVYQPVQAPPKPASTGRISRWTNRLHWPQRSTPRGEPIAFIERLYDLNSLEALTPIPPFPLRTAEVTIGNDPDQATIVLEEQTVAGLHAKIYQNVHQEFFVSDFGSISGTYVNFNPTNGNPIRIDHGDQIHFGTVGFRFLINPPPQVPLPSIIEKEDEAS